MKIKIERAYLLNLLSRDLLKARGNLGDLQGLGAINQGRAGKLNTGVKDLSGLECAELGQGDSLLDFLGGDLTGSDLLESIGSALGDSGNRVGLARDGNGEETGVRVGVVLGRNLDAVALGGLPDEREARSPLDRRLASQQSSQNSNLRLVSRGAVLTGAGEADNDGVSGLAGSALLTTVELAGYVLLDLELTGRCGRGVLAKELAHPFGNLCRIGADGDKSNVGFGIGALGEFSNTLAGNIRLYGGGRGGVKALTKAAVESSCMSRVQGHIFCLLQKDLLAEPEVRKDKFVQLICCADVRFATFQRKK